MRCFARLLQFITVLGILLFIFNHQARAATFTVNQAGDAGDLTCDATCTLRDAIDDANNAGSNDTIDFAPSLTTITLSSSDIVINNNGSLTINGLGADKLTIDGGTGANRIFYINGATVTITGVTLTGGNGFGSVASGNGGAINTIGGSLTLDRVHVSGNTSSTSNFYGGGAAFQGGTHIIRNSTFSNNNGVGGAVHISTGTLLIVNSTISGNSSSSIFEGGGALNTHHGNITLRNVTIAANTSTGTGGGVYLNGAGTVNFGNTIVAGNTATGGQPEVFYGVGTIASAGNNLVGDSSGDAANTNNPITYQGTDILDTPPQLLALGNYGGSTPTRALQVSSPARDAGSDTLANAEGLTTDQRGAGFLRIVDTSGGTDDVDIGAFEIDLGAFQLLACTQPPSGMVSWWPGDGSAIDIQGTNNGTLGSTTFDDGKVGRAFKFVGTNAVTIPNSASLQFNGSITVEAWINPTLLGSNGLRTLIAQFSTTLASDNAFRLTLNENSGVLQPFGAVRRSDGTEIGMQGGLVTPGVFSHIAMTYNAATGLHEIYVNGTRVVFQTLSAVGLNPTTLPVTFGQTSTGANSYTGLIDEVEIFTRALSQSEIQALYNAGSAGKCRSCIERPSGMIFWQPADRHAQDIVLTNDGVLQNGVTYLLGMVGHAYRFDGTNDHVQIAQNTFDGLTDVTVDAWVRFDVLDSPTSDFQTIISALDSGNAHYWTLMKKDTGELRLDLSVTDSIPSCEIIQAPPTPFVAGRFYHIAATKSGGVIKLYVDGQEISSTSTACTGAIRANTGTTFIGGQEASPVDRVLDGSIDELEIYNRALSADEIARLYAARAGGKCKPEIRRADFDGDLETDASFWRPSTGNWHLLQSTNGVSVLQWGLDTFNDQPVPGDYDGDKKTDLSIWRPSEGNWYIVNSSDNSVTAKGWGSESLGDVPVPGDYDGDRRTDIAVWRASEGNWYILNSFDNSVTLRNWGAASLGDKPVAGDYDGDGRTDIAVWRPSEGNWYIINSRYNSATIKNWGAGALNDQPVPADYDGDGRVDIAVWRPSEGNWYIINSSNNTVTLKGWGAGSLGDKPVTGDYDGDGRADIAVWRESEGNWYIIRSSDNGVSLIGWGANGDLPIPWLYFPD